MYQAERIGLFREIERERERERERKREIGRLPVSVREYRSISRERV